MNEERTFGSVTIQRREKVIPKQPKPQHAELAL